MVRCDAAPASVKSIRVASGQNAVQTLYAAGSPMTAELPAALLDAIRDARVDLDLQPDGDPAEALLDWIEERGPRREKVQAENEAMVRLADQLGATLAALDEKKRALRETEEALGAAGAELEKARGAAAAESHETDA